ncbi:hypothetical protein PLICRDRAFT_114277 [Plicaturopsis crispa FD-325 SS-3]|nr:hypothetical protein PLICRDRAFT_114277 [Plicaturopsis crispa FD-325 SS-3]
MVAQTKGYYARDFSLGLGFNNVRYIIEAALAQARILNRTAILPSFVYARSCEYHITVCADYAEMLNRGDAVGWDEWRELPFEEQMGWRVPMTVMLNITHMRRYQPVLLVSEYLRLHDLPTDLERDNGAWDSYAYHTNAEIFDPQNRIPDLHEIENQWFDPQNVTRVDMMPQDMKTRGGWDPEYEDASIGQRGMWTNVELSQEYLQLEAALPEDRRYLNWDEARDALHEKLKILENSDSDQALENLVKASGWEVLYTFDGALGMDYSKTVIKPIRHVVQRESLRSFLDDFGDIDANVVHLAGEIHLGRKPGGLRFTTTAGRDEFARLPLYAVRAPDALLQLAGRLDERMMAKNDGRMWMGAHMRRGDFSKVGWAMEKSIVDHLARIKRRLDGGRAILGLISDLDIHPYAIPEGHVDYSILNMKPPRDGDQFYLATDERDPDNLLYLSQNGAVLIQDILTIEDRREFGWPLMLTDVLALVEQAVLVRGHYFYGHAMSSVAGGVSNMRAANGRDPRTELID